jgi:hypothetical protein
MNNWQVEVVGLGLFFIDTLRPMKTNFSQFPISILNLTDDLFRVK